LHLPTQLFSWPLAILEKVALPLLPVTRGQLRTFTSDGIADNSTFLTAHRPGMTSVMEWLAPGEQPHARSTVTNTPMDSECQVFTRYLTGQDASPQVRQKYKALNEIRNEFWPGGDAEPFDTRLISIAVRGPRWARIADSYARWFCPGSRLRKKMVLLLALLECTSPSFRYLDETDSENRLVSYSVLMLTALVALASLAAGIVVIGPQHWFSGIRTSSDPARLTE